jgi:hypothetical protein
MAYQRARGVKTRLAKGTGQALLLRVPKTTKRPAVAAEQDKEQAQPQDAPTVDPQPAKKHAEPATHEHKTSGLERLARRLGQLLARLGASARPAPAPAGASTGDRDERVLRPLRSTSPTQLFMLKRARLISEEEYQVSLRLLLGR